MALSYIQSIAQVGDDLVVTGRPGTNTTVRIVGHLGAGTVEEFANIDQGGAVVTLSTSLGGGAPGIIAGTNRGETLDSRGGDDILFGNGGRDVLIGGCEDDTTSGGAGGDRFVFRPGDGDDRITDFAAGPGRGDGLDLRAFGFDDLSDVLGRTTNWRGNAVIRRGDSVTLVDVTRASLVADDVLV
jgi:hypothetical protein